MQTACGIEEDHVVAVLLGMADSGLGDGNRILLPHLEDGNAELTADDLQLLDGGRTVNVAGDEKRTFALLFK